jgi:hypothetical protein
VPTPVLLENPYPRKSKKSKEVAKEHSEEEEEDEDRVKSEDEAVHLPH